jgi:hypothetical protein
MARTLNPNVRVLARASYLRDVPSLRAAGANRVYSGEGEVALAFIEDILDSLGATPEQIDRERARAHAELSGRPDDADVREASGDLSWTTTRLRTSSEDGATKPDDKEGSARSGS